MNYDFWKRIHDYAKKKMHDAYHKKNLCSVRCPYCLTWDWETNGLISWNYNETGDLATMVCKKCKRESKWGTDSALPYCLNKKTVKMNSEQICREIE